ncbi:MAG: hypothetical protein DRI61_09275 [Chloroflexi bacterium]|nr:MAG: hypothetical protein DRI61_09275 [Chloroflexota bacterium]
MATKLEVQRECLYSTTASVVGIPDGTSFKIVWGWRNHARGKDWSITKTVVSANSEITIELSETEASQLPFLNGYLTIYKIDSGTGKKSLNASYDVIVYDGTADSDYVSTTSSATAIPLSYWWMGNAEVGFLSNSPQLNADGTLTKIEVGCQDAPLGQSIIFEIYINAVATGVTISLAAGDTNNSATISQAVSQGDEVTVRINQTGNIPAVGVAPWACIQYTPSS